MKEKFIEFIKFSIIGGIMTVLSLLLFYFFIELLNVEYLVSNILSYTIAVILSFFLNSKFTFNVSDQNFKVKSVKIFKYTVMKLVMLLLDSILLFVLVDLLKFNVYFSKILLTIVLFLFTYSISKIIIEKGERNEKIY